MNYSPYEIHDDEKLLLGSLEGLAAFRLLLPLIRALALYIAGRDRFPQALEAVPELKSDVALERARYRAATGKELP